MRSQTLQIPGQMTLREWVNDIGPSIPKKIKYKAAPRYPWEYYGITKERHKQLTDYIRSGGYIDIVIRSANETNKDIVDYIFLSITKNLSYEGLQILWELNEIDRMPCGRSDFYGWRRYFYHLFDLELRRIGK